MKKIVALLFAFCITFGYAQITTPGTGKTYTFLDLSQDTSGTVISDGHKGLAIYKDITISAGDTLLLDAATMAVKCFGPITINIKGGHLCCETRRDEFHFCGSDLSETPSYFQMRLTDSATAEFTKVVFEVCNGIFISQSQVAFDQCHFQAFTAPVIKYMYCNPIIEHCYFHDNQSAAISSAANVTGSPIIRNNTFTNNVLSNVNQPQLNLGPGNAEDTLIIEGNLIEGRMDMSGGIALANLLKVGQTYAIIRNNIIKSNRYGYNQQGSNITSLIEDNQFLDNDLETNPNNGGSGISIYGSDTTCVAKLRNNIIRGNLWGITAIYYHTIDMGTAEDPGGNLLYSNSNNGTTYALYNNAFSNITAIGNYWGGNTEEFAESVIFHQPDQSGLGLVTYAPVMEIKPTVSGCRAFCANRDTLIEGTLSPNTPYTFAMQFEMPAGEIFDPTEWTFKLDVPEYVTYSLSDSSFTYNPKIYTRLYHVETPGGASQGWKILFTITESVSVADYEETSVNLYPNPATTRCHIQASSPIQQIEVLNMLGQSVFRQAADGNNHYELSVGNWSKGLYLVKIQTAEGLNTSKLEVR